MSIDPSALESYREFMGEEADSFIDDIVTSYRDNTPKLIASLETALAKDDHGAFTIAAHTLKSNSATIGATTLAQQCADLEQQGKSGEIKGLQDPVASVKEVLQGVLEELKTLYP